MGQATAVATGFAGRPITNQPPPTNAVPANTWQAFGEAVLDFHRPVGVSAMCQCGRTYIECDVWAQARQYGIRRPTT